MLSSMTVNQLGEINRLVSALRDKMIREEDKRDERAARNASLAEMENPYMIYPV